MLNKTMEKAEGISFWKKLGKIKLGEKVKGKLKCDQRHEHKDECFTWYPKDLDYFVVEEKWHVQLGAKPKELEIALAFPTLLQNFDTGRAVYQQNKARWCYSNDGETAFRWGKTGAQQIVKGRNGQPDTKVDAFDYMKMPCPGDACPYAKQCPARGYLNVIT